MIKGFAPVIDKTGLSVEDIDAQIRELTSQRQAALMKVQQDRLKEEFEEAGVLLGRLAEDMRRLHAIGYLPQRVADALKDKKGKVNIGQYVKRPSAIRSGSREEEIED